ncbi:MAG: c-type cytochrome biogenesis protein CcmI [Hyphomicrobiaceae bacterium]|nr:c-type cytochrome biogenesis protein CcmI [Hyphomicrobiaceae bacterium]
MLLWLVFALLSAGVVAVLLRPLLRPAPTPPGDAAGTTAVYRDQLAEIDAEAQRGLLAPEEAEAARREIARRLIASATPSQSATDGKPPFDGASNSSRIIAIALGLVMPVAAIAIYAGTGAPSLPAQPFAHRRAPPPADAEVTRLVAAVEARLAQNPKDGRGWDVIAPVYLRMERFGDAADAYQRAIDLLGRSTKRLAGLAEALMLGDEGRISPRARTALQGILELEPGNVQARFWLAHAKEQEGRLVEAAADYEQLLATAPAGADWRQPLEERLAAVREARAASPPGATLPPAGSNGGIPGAAASGPSAADIAAAERLSPGERQAMIDGMVSGLAARLEKDGSDLVGWERLIRALTVMGRRDEAIAALGRARKSLRSDPKAEAALGELARSLGLGS